MSDFVIQHIEIAFVFLGLGIAGMLWVIIMDTDDLLHVQSESEVSNGK